MTPALVREDGHTEEEGHVTTRHPRTTSPTGSCTALPCLLLRLLASRAGGTTPAVFQPQVCGSLFQQPEDTDPASQGCLPCPGLPH